MPAPGLAFGCFDAGKSAPGAPESFSFCGTHLSGHCLVSPGGEKQMLTNHMRREGAVPRDNPPRRLADPQRDRFPPAHPHPALRQ